ncbi:hypothetical protein DERP_007846 [Dermatophagoides pteronyssinus]|uniref:Uncharacterized protein n=1 Tax=Dermatophagoides pteronyssinus TaxID=6956 RepID=A0ABQ8ITH7_DERPT|nr:hypothetical protein DERP_007846 [Dermatophagoides pteronyssinus]
MFLNDPVLLLLSLLLFDNNKLFKHSKCDERRFLKRCNLDFFSLLFVLFIISLDIDGWNVFDLTIFVVVIVGQWSFG